jgi:hypothetical protein
MIIRRLFGSTVVAVILLTSRASLAAASPAPHPGLTKLRAATAKFHKPGHAKGKGYGLFTDTAGISCIAEPGMGAMGVTKAPNRFGLPAFYSLHVWVWKHSPAGMFAMWNPTVHCPS